ncbi:MAG: Bax inhibitor-1/YccA family protein [Actinomycetaceae bacterium]|nr:Bax inhibitor-1/YccA family protein [Actinomycetaceae bacterium]
MANPVMSRLDEEFAQTTPAGYPTMPGYQPGVRGQNPAGSQRDYGQHYQQTPVQQYGRGYGDQHPGQMPMEQYERSFGGQSADAVDRGQMTYDDVVVKTGSMLGLLILVAAGSWVLTLTSPGIGMMMMLGGLIGGFVLAMVNIFSKKIRPALVMAYAAAEGLAIGAFSAVFEVMYPGIVVQAALATFAVMGAALALFATGKVRYTSKVNRFVLIGLIALVLYNLASMILVWTGVIANPWGIGGMEIMGIPIGVFVGVFAIILGTLSLIGDYDVARRGVEAGAPKIFAWKVAFGIMVTVVWLYIEILRLIAIIRSE